MTNYNDLLAEWIDSFAMHEGGDYNRGKDGSFNWIDWCTWGEQDFDKFVKERLS